MPELLVQIGDSTLPLRSCHWVLIGPNGCAYASEYGDGATNSEQAHHNFTPRLRERERQTRQGYRVELLSKDEWRKRIGPCFYGTCTHRQLTTKESAR
ncbi:MULTISPECIES: hypothetical protein [unclassified Streptomyces]|uniref:hypothetical protein n=1 Tax=unclassified Streptomyces TaxID=2593676 RepID=UPI00081F58F3|nr:MULTISPECIES: hypothetical protein [unclassified Streptomyces]MYR30569.1 hypothetical protein [Streptomyces sp. SID4945]SCF50146.1 hypothetical protein GA0115257_12418 [Streptomyces sp. LcepLS]